MSRGFIYGHIHKRNAGGGSVQAILIKITRLEYDVQLTTWLVVAVHVDGIESQRPDMHLNVASSRKCLRVGIWSPHVCVWNDM